MRTISILVVGIVLSSVAGSACGVTLLDFEDMPLPTPPTKYTLTPGNDWFVTNNVRVTLDAFSPPSTSGGRADADDSVFVSDPSMNKAGGTGIAMHTDNINLVFVDAEVPSHEPMDSISFLWGEYGGNVNLNVNGDLYTGDDLTGLGPTLGGASVSVVSLGPTPDGGNELGQLTVTGVIETFKIGGQELWIDNVEGSPNFPPPPPVDNPALSEWGLIIMAVLLVGAGTIAIWRRRQVAV